LYEIKFKNLKNFFVFSYVVIGSNFSFPVRFEKTGDWGGGALEQCDVEGDPKGMDGSKVEQGMT
jgi:hypothetical protein